MSNSFRTIASNTLAQLVAKAVGVLLTLATTIMIIRLGGPDLFGDLTKSLALIAIGYTAIDFGLNAAAVRLMGTDESSRIRLFADTFYARLLLSLLAILVLNLVIWLLPGGYNHSIKSTFLVGSLSIVFLGFYTSCNALFQRRLAYWRSTFALLIGTIIGTGLTYFVVVTSPTLFNLLFVYTIGYFFTAGLALLLLGKFSLPFSSSRVLRLLKSSFWLGTTLIGSILASRIDTIILGIFRPSAEVGYYGLSYRAFEVALTLPTFAMNSLFPLLLDARGSARRRLLGNSTLALFLISLVGSLVLYLAAPLLLFIRPGLDPAVHSFRLLVLFLPLFYLSSPLMWSLITAGKEKLLLGIYLLAALGNGLLNLLLVPSYGLLAASLATGATEAFILLCLLYFNHALTRT